MTYYGNYLGPQNLVNPANIQVITTSTALGQTSYGITYLVQNSGSTTITLPVVLVGSITKQITLVNDSATGTVTINAQGTNTIRSLGVASSSFTLTAGDVVVLENNGTSWSVVTTSSWKANLNSPALTGIPTTPTATQFTNSTQIANTAFVQTALGSLSGAPSPAIATSTVLTASSMGNLIILGGSSAATLTLPLISSLTPGATIYVVNGQNVAWSIAGQGSDKIDIGSSALSSFILNLGDFVALTVSETVWRVWSGSSILQYTNALTGSFTSTQGYQRMPNGTLIQWGNGTSNSSGVAAFTFPIAFPTACTSLVTNYLVNGAGLADVVSNASTLTTTTAGTAIVAHAASSTAVASAQVKYVAIGY